MRSFGTESAQTCPTFWGIVDTGWRVAPVPTRVGTRACVHEEGCARERRRAV